MALCLHFMLVEAQCTLPFLLIFIGRVAQNRQIGGAIYSINGGHVLVKSRRPELLVVSSIRRYCKLERKWKSAKQILRASTEKSKESFLCEEVT